MQSLIEKDANMEVEQKKENPPDDMVDEGDGMMSCPVCTFVNAASNQNC